MAHRTLLLLLGLVLFAPWGAGLAAQAVPDTAGVRFGLRLGFADSVAPLITPPTLRATWAGVRRSPERAGAAFDSVATARATSRTQALRHDRLLLQTFRRQEFALDLLPVDDRAVPDRGGLFGLDADLVDMSLNGTIRLEMSTDRFANLRCTPAELQDPLSGCQPSFRPPRVDNYIQMQAQGVIGRRLYIDVDLDTQRDFNNANTIRAYYQGLEDEVLQRVDVGTVRFAPPPSRFLTAGIPTNNFGISATAEYGPLTVSGLAATQKGSVVAERSYRIGEQTVQDQERLVRDLDYESGRFFWVVDPTVLPGYPRVDALALGDVQVPAGVRPDQVRVYRYRAAAGNVGTNPNLGGISAVAVNDAGVATQAVGPLRWELLVQGEHYWLDPSGLWFVLQAKLDPNDFLAVSYVREDGTEVGSFPSTDDPARADSLLLVVEPNRGPEAGTFRHALRNIYRVAGSDLDRSTLGVAVLVNRSERPPDGVATWMALFDLAVPTDQAVFDTDNHLFPRTRDPGAAEVIRDHFVVFPTLEPFADAARIPDPAQRNDSLYRTPEYLLLTQGPSSKFQVRLEYVATGGGDRSNLNLNAVQIREGTEQLYLDGRRLVRGVDYSIGYETGLVSFLDPEGLFGLRTATLTARFEERGFFAVAPTTIVGLTARYQLGEAGGINLVGLYQSEETAFIRPPLGFEPTASLIGGLSTDLQFNVPSVSRFLSRLLPGGMSAPSRLSLDAEVAFSLPDPNRSGEATLEEFEADRGIPISLRENAWQHGSVPQSGDGVEQFGFGAGFDSTHAVQLVWQNLIPDGQGGALRLRPVDIDTNIVIQGGATATPETVMYLTFHADTAGGIVARNNSSAWTQPRIDFAPRFRSMVTPLSITGVDLSRNEFLEFWVFESASRPIGTNDLQMVIDLGTVSEDAASLAPTTFTVDGTDTTFTGRQFVGVGELNTERSPTGTFNAAIDDIGILGDRPVLTLPSGGQEVVELCRRALTNLVEVYPWGDLSSRCSVGNGLLDTEDLDGDLLLNARGTTEDAFRYVVDLTDPKYRVRTGVQNTPDPEDPTRVAGWTLYRVPLRNPDRLIGQPNIRLVKHLRFTMLTPPDNGQPDEVIRFALARMRLVGAPWIARAEQPILGLSGSLGEPHGRVGVSSISTENIELGYTSPPGLGSTLNQVGAGREGIGQQVNEKSLRIVAEDLRTNERAEAYNRFVSGSQNLLAYRELRVWARGRGAGWEDRQLRAYVKVGSDDRNFYYFESVANSSTWEPDLVVNLELWRALRAEAEGSFLRGEPPNGSELCGGDPEAWVACQDGHLVHLRDPAINPPNLAAVQEIATGIRNVSDGPPIAEAELWVDDIRLSAPIADAGVAMAVTGRLQAGDFGDVNLSYVTQNGQFRQVGQDPSYRGTRAFGGGTTLQLGRFFPEAVGLVAPLTVTHNRTSEQPQLLTGSDLRASALEGLRRPRSTATTVGVSLRRIRQDGSLLVRGLVNPVTLTGNYSRGFATTTFSEGNTSNWATALTWQLNPRRRVQSLGLAGVMARLPDWLGESEGGQGIARGGFSLVPSTLRFSTALSRQAAEYVSFSAPIQRLQDTAITPVTTLQHLWRTGAGVNWQPLGMLTVATSWQSTRDLRVYPDSTPLGRLVGDERRQFLGIDGGVERDRNLSSTIGINPVLSSWLRPRLTTTSNFVLSRSLTARNPVRLDGDTAGAFILPQTLNNSRTTEVGATIEPGVLIRRAFGDSSGVSTFFERFRVLDLTRRLTLQSTYDLATFDPGAGYQFATGGLRDFLRQGDEFAVGAAETRSTDASGGVELPFGLTATASYTLSEVDRYQRTGGDRFILTETTQRDWPNATLRWSQTFTTLPIQLLSVSATLRERETRSVIPSADLTAPAAITEQRSESFSPDATIIFRNGLTLNARAGRDRGTALTNGNTIFRNTDNWTVGANWQIRLPRSISALRRPLRAELRSSRVIQEDCIRSLEDTECEIISAVTRDEYLAVVSTDVVGVVEGEFGAQWVINELKHLGRKSSAVTLTLSVSVPLSFGGY